LNQFDAKKIFAMSRPLGFGQRTVAAFGNTPPLTVSVHENFSDISYLWHKFQIHTASTLYQTYQWCSTWQRTVGSVNRSSPRILVACDSSGDVVFILPLQMRKSFGLQILEWHGYPTVNYGYGLFNRGFVPNIGLWFTENLALILELAGPFDVLALRDMPERMDGELHPLHSVFNLKAANRSYAMKIHRDFEALYATKRSKDTRHSNRKKDRKLSALGDLKFSLPSSPHDVHAVLDSMFQQKTEQLAENGVHGVFGRVEMAFIHQLAEETIDGKPVLMPFTLTCDGKVMAVILGGYANNSCWLLISSMGQGDARKYSPGDYVLRNMIEDCCKRGLDRIDFASGDANYKAQWAEDMIDLYATFRARNLKGLLWVVAMALSLRTKRHVKQTPGLWKPALVLRRLIAGHKPRP
jgi:CelD/BcsL family acetyltransferase involved in cellulose biosynthesis